MQNDLVRMTVKKDPRGVHYSNCGFVELDSFAVSRLRRVPAIAFYAWSSPPTAQSNQIEPKTSPRDPLRLAHYYQSLLDTGKFESLAAPARFLGVGRARVTQVLCRLKMRSECQGGICDQPTESQIEPG